MEGKEWNTKGPYTTALELDEGITWTQDSGAYVLHMSYEADKTALGYSGFAMGGIIPQGLRDSPAVASEVGSSATGLTGLSGVSGLMTGPSVTGNLTFKEKLVTVLQIPSELVNHLDNGLSDAWKKYKAYLDAAKKLDELWEAGQLRNVFDKKPVQTDLRSLFKGKTQWHETYQRTFPRLHDYPQMIAWLENQEDRPHDIDLWGVRKANYTFTDLKVWLENGGEGLGDESSSDIVPQKKKDKKKVKVKVKEKQGSKGHDDGKGKSREQSKGKKKKGSSSRM